MLLFRSKFPIFSFLLKIDLHQFIASKNSFHMSDIFPGRWIFLVIFKTTYRHPVIKLFFIKVTEAWSFNFRTYQQIQSKMNWKTGKEHVAMEGIIKNRF